LTESGRACVFGRESGTLP